MALEDDIRLLSAVPLFASLTAEQLRLVAFGAENLRLTAGRTAYRENAPGDCAFIITEGEVDLIRAKGNETITVSTEGPGSILDELALIAPTTRALTAVARTDAALIRLNRSLFRRILEEYPEVAEQMRNRIAANLHQMASAMQDLSRRFSD